MSRQDQDRIGTVVRLRKLREDRARAEAAAAAAEVERTGAVVDEERERVRSRAPLPSVLPPVLLRALQLQGMASAELLADAAAEHERSVQARIDAQRQLAEEAGRRKSVQKLAEKRRLEHLAAVRASAEREMDALVLQQRAHREESS